MFCQMVNPMPACIQDSHNFTETHHAILDMKRADGHKTAPHLCLLYEEISTVWY
jgi:hypothetical protein